MSAIFILEIPCLSSPVKDGKIDKSGNVGQGEVIQVQCNPGFQLNGTGKYKCGLENPPLCTSEKTYIKPKFSTTDGR